MMAEVLTSFAGTEAFLRLLQRPKEELAQRVLVGIDMIRDLRALQTDTRDCGPVLEELLDRLSYSQARIIELEEALAEANDTISRLVEGNACGWDA